MVSALEGYAGAVRMVLSADEMSVVRMRMPLHPPAAADVAVVFPQKEVERARKRRDQRDVRQRTADEVVATVGRPVNHGVERSCQRHPPSLAPTQTSFPSAGAGSIPNRIPPLSRQGRDHAYGPITEDAADIPAPLTRPQPELRDAQASVTASDES